MKKVVKSLLVSLSAMSILTAGLALTGCNNNGKGNYVDYTLDSFVYSVSGQESIYVDSDNMTPSDHLAYDSVIQMYGTKASISDDYIEFNGTVLSAYGKIGYQLEGETVTLSEPALTQMFNYVKLSNGIFYFGIQIETLGMTVTYTFEYYSPDAIMPSYQVTFDSQGGSYVNAATVTKGDAVTKPGDPARLGYTFGNWYADKACTREWDFTTKIYMDTTIYVKWVPNRNFISYNTNGGTSINSDIVYSGDKIYKPRDPEKTGHTFAGWYRDSAFTTPYDFSTEVTGNMTLYANWTANKYTITFDANGGTLSYTTMTVTYGTRVKLPTPTRPGYTFDCWVDDDYYIFESSAIYNYTRDITLIAYWN